MAALVSSEYTFQVDQRRNRRDRGGCIFPLPRQKGFSETCKIILMTAVSKAWQCLSRTYRRKIYLCLQVSKPAHMHTFSSQVTSYARKKDVVSLSCRRYASVGVLVKQNK